MPSYNFRCSTSGVEKDFILTIPEYKNYIKDSAKCDECGRGIMVQSIGTVAKRIEKSLDQIKFEIEDDVKRIARKIREGDAQTIDDIFGDKPNEHKDFGSYYED